MRATTRKAILLTVLAGIVAFVVLDSTEEGRFTGALLEGVAKSGEPAALPSTVQGKASAESGGQFTLPERAPLSEPRADIFGSQSWQPPASNIAAKPLAPVAPPMPYQYAGKLVHDGQLSVLLSKGDAVFPIKVGETLDGAYRVETIGEDRITLIYLPLKHRESIPVISALPPAGGDVQAPAVPAQPASQAKPATGPVVGPAPAARSRGATAPTPTPSVIGNK